MCSPLVFVSGRNKKYFPLLTDSDSFSNADFHAHIKPEREYSINHLLKSSMTVQDLNTLHHICEF